MIKFNRGSIALTVAVGMCFAIIAVPAVIVPIVGASSLTETRQEAQVSADIRTAEQIGKALRIWATDIDADGDRSLPNAPVEYSEVYGLTPAYISSGYTAKSLALGTGKYYVTSVGTGYYKKICVYIGEEPPTQPTDAVTVDYDGLMPGWAYAER